MLIGPHAATLWAALYVSLIATPRQAYFINWWIC